MEELEVYDHLADKETLIIYMARSGEGRITLSGGMLTQDRNTRILRDSYDYRPVHKRKVNVGERLMCSAVVPGQTLQTRRTIPTDWVVSEVERYEPSADIPGFREIIIAYCDRQPLSLFGNLNEAIATHRDGPKLPHCERPVERRGMWHARGLRGR